MLRAALGLLLFLAGCGSPPGLVELPTPAPSLAARLLTAEDLPGFAHFDYYDPGLNDVRGCDPLSIPERPDASTQFRAGENGPYIHATLSLRSDADARAAMESARRVLRECATFTSRTPDGQTVTTAVEPGVITGLGHETIAVRFTTTTMAGQPPFLSDQVVVRSGRLLIAVAHNNFQNVDTTLTQLAIERAVARAGALK